MKLITITDSDLNGIKEHLKYLSQHIDFLLTQTSTVSARVEQAESKRKTDPNFTPEQYFEILNKGSK